ncbi:MAG: HEAT repeat domain-containing protein [Verrucomicrobiae bacterium]|nr:HEAT repeat domain-containing protein [Verrucomicrobiae bacterium]
MKSSVLALLFLGTLSLVYSAPAIQEIRTVISGTIDYQEGQDEELFRQLDQFIREAAGDERLQRSIEAALIEVLESDASPACKQRICSRLQLVGTNEAVSALQKLLLTGDRKLVEAACYALSSNGSESSRQALRSALPELKGLNLQTVVNLLGELQDHDSTVPLIKLASKAELETKAAIFRALGELANTPVVEFLSSQLKSNNQEVIRLAGLGLASAAQNLESTGHAEMAEAIYDSLLDGRLPSFIRRGAFLGKIRVLDYHDTFSVIEAIQGDDATLSNAAISLIPNLQGELATLRVSSILFDLPESTRIPVIRALVRRGDKAAFVSIIPLLDIETDDSLFLQVISRLGDASFVPVLLRNLEKPQSVKLSLYRDCLVQMADPLADPLLIDALERSGGDFKKTIIEILGARGSNLAIPALMQLAQVRKGVLAGEALRAMRNCGRVEDLPHLVRLLDVHAGTDNYRAVREMLAVLAQKASANGVSGVDVLGSMSQSADKPLALELLHILGMVREPTGLKFLVDVFDSQDPDLRQKAYDSTMRIAHLSVSREENNPNVRAALKELSAHAKDASVRDQASKLLKPKSE